MPQHDYQIDNASGASVRSDVNAALLAIATWNSGAAPPATTHANLTYVDTTASVIRRRNAANSAWIDVETADESLVVTRAGNVVLDRRDRGKTIRATASFTQTFAAAATLTDRWWCHYLIDAGATITFDPAGAELFDNVATRAVTGPASLLIVSDGTGLRTLYGAVVIEFPAVMGVGRNIRGGNVGTNQIRMIADELILRDPASGQARRIATVDQTPDITVSGANGLDTGTRAANTWYYGWIIENPAGTRAGLISASATAPTMPSGFTFRALVSAVRNDGSNLFLGYAQHGAEMSYTMRRQFLAGGTATTETAVNYSAFVPPIAHTTHLHAESYHNDGSGNGAWLVYYVDAGANGLILGLPSVNGTVINQRSALSFSVRNTGTILYHWGTALGGRSLDMIVTGFTLPIGGQ